MSSTIVITVVAVVAIGWLVFLGISALRSRRSEEVSANLAPGMPDDYLETSRIERYQQVAVLFSAFLALSLPLYFLYEPGRQEGFVDEFHEQNVERGKVAFETGFQCQNCHGPEGVGGSAAFVDPRTGASVTWTAPSLNDIFYRYSREEVAYWITYGRAGTPMAAWGVAGGGPANEAEVEALLDYLESVQIPQSDVVAEAPGTVTTELGKLENADSSMADAILRQRQLIAGYELAPELVDPVQALATEARGILDGAAGGIDTDGDGLADSAETELNRVTGEAFATFLFPGLGPVELDPANPATNGTGDLAVVEDLVATMRDLVESEQAPIIEPDLAALEGALAGRGADADGDGLSDEAEGAIPGIVDAAIGKIVPSSITVLALDPTNPATAGGAPDLDTATTAVSGLESAALNLGIQRDNLDKLLGPAEETLADLRRAASAKLWEFDLEAIAGRTFGGDAERAGHIVGVFNGYCARCHTSGFSAGLPFTQEAGSGGLGPAIFQGRPAVQFLTDEDLAAFITEGSEANIAYGVNGMGTGRMPAFGQILSAEDIADLARWLRAGDLTGKGEG